MLPLSILVRDGYARAWILPDRADGPAAAGEPEPVRRERPALLAAVRSALASLRPARAA